MPIQMETCYWIENWIYYCRRYKRRQWNNGSLLSQSESIGKMRDCCLVVCSIGIPARFE